MLWYVAGALMLLILLRKVQVRLALSRAKHRSITGHSRMARRIAALIPYYESRGAGFSTPTARRRKSQRSVAPHSSDC